MLSLRPPPLSVSLSLPQQWFRNSVYWTYELRENKNAAESAEPLSIGCPDTGEESLEYSL